jgi:hypothetical protein
MTQQERLDKFKTLYKPKEGYTMLFSLTDTFNAWVFKRVQIISRKGLVFKLNFSPDDYADTYLCYVGNKDIQEFIKELDNYIEKKSI